MLPSIGSRPSADFHFVAHFQVARSHPKRASPTGGIDTTSFSKFEAAATVIPEKLHRHLKRNLECDENVFCATISH
jgi:hypothetical protein